MNDEAAPESLLRVEVSEDAQQAHLVIDPETPEGEITRALVRRTLFEAGIPVTDEVRARIEVLLETLAEQPLDEPFLIASGEAPRPGEPGAVSFTRAEHVFEYFFVEHGDKIGKLDPPTPGVTGRDVFCREIPLDTPEAVITLGPNVYLDPDGCTICAAATGTFSTTVETPTVQRALIISGDISQSDGQLGLRGDVIVRGAIRDGVEVRTEGAILVEDAIQASPVHAGRGLFVQGGITGQHEHVIISDAGAHAHHCAGVTMRVARDLHIDVECVNAIVEVGGSFRGPKASVVGGSVRVRAEMEAGVLGCESGTATEVTLGLDDDALQQLPVLRQDSAQLQSECDELQVRLNELHGIERPDAGQREQITEVTFEIAQREAQIEEMQRGIDAILCDTDGKPFPPSTLTVREKIWAGTRIRIDDRTFSLDKNLRGPVRFDIDNRRPERPLRAESLGTGRVVYLAQKPAAAASSA